MGVRNSVGRVRTFVERLPPERPNYERDISRLRSLQLRLFRHKTINYFPTIATRASRVLTNSLKFFPDSRLRKRAVALQRLAEYCFKQSYPSVAAEIAHYYEELLTGACRIFVHSWKYPADLCASSWRVTYEVEDIRDLLTVGVDKVDVKWRKKVVDFCSKPVGAYCFAVLEELDVGPVYELEGRYLLRNQIDIESVYYDMLNMNEEA